MNIDQIARLAGVSTATISRVINGSSSVRPATAERVRRLIEDVGYVPNQSARTLSSGQSRIFAAIIANVTNPWVAELLHEFQNECAAHGFDAIFAGTDLDPARTTTALRRMIERQVDGIAIFMSQMDQESASLILRHNVPICGLAYGPGEGVYQTLRTDYVPGIGQAIAHLKKLGHKNIAFISGPMGEFTARLRLDLFRIAMADADLRVHPDLVQEGDWKTQGGVSATRALLKCGRDFTAVLCSNDAMATGVLRALRSAGLDVPRDVSVIGTDDLDIAALAEPPLTTIRVPRRDIAKLAFQRLFESSQKKSPRVRESSVATTLVVRESTAPAPKGKPKPKRSARRSK